MALQKRPRDVNQLAHGIVEEAVGEHPPVAAPATGKEKDPEAVARGRKGGLKGGAARAATLTPEERSASARKAARARWRKP
jgi:hypothetical protein